MTDEWTKTCFAMHSLMKQFIVLEFYMCKIILWSFFCFFKVCVVVIFLSYWEQCNIIDVQSSLESILLYSGLPYWRSWLWRGGLLRGISKHFCLFFNRETAVKIQKFEIKYFGLKLPVKFMSDLEKRIFFSIHMWCMLWLSKAKQL